MADAPDERLARGMETARKLFPPGSPGSPSFRYPPEIQADWGSLSVSTVLGDVWGRPGLEPNFLPPQPGEVRHSIADISKIRRVLGFHPETGLAEKIDEVIAWNRAEGAE